MTVHQVAAQLRKELGAAASALGAIAGPEMLVELERAVTARADLLAAQLVSDDDQVAGQVAVDVMAVLWPRCDPEHLDPGWWSTPLGRVVARSVGHSTAESVSRSVAAAMLGVRPGTVAQWTHRGTLDRHPDGGVLRASVLQRLAR